MTKQLKYIYTKINTIRVLSNKHISKLAYALICMLIYSCAQVVAPNGGKKDITPPKVVKYVPDSASLNVEPKSIAINFDEFIQLKDLNGQLIISPPLENTPDIKVRNKTLSIEFDKNEVLKPNTTYAINFGNAVQDIHENNAIDNFRYIFSTGSFIDSLTVKGKVQNAFDHKADKGILVMLYTDFNDSVIYKKKPDYFAKTKEDGSFQIDNVHKGTYKLMVLKDANANYKYDTETESIGFIDSLIDVSKKKNIVIDLFQEPAKKLFLKKITYNAFGKIIFIFNRSADNLSITPLNTTIKAEDLILDYSKNKDTLNYWFRNAGKDSLILQVKNGNKVIDTVRFKLMKREDALQNKRNPLKLTLVSSPAGNQTFDLNAEFNLVFNNPIVKWDKKPIQLKEDTVNSPTKPNELYYSAIRQIVSLSNNPDRGIPPIKGDNFTNWKENTPYHLFIPPGTFTDFFGLTNDTIKIDFKTREESFYGTLKLKITIPETKGQYIVQLLDEKENVIRENTIHNSETLMYKYLYPQKCRLKIIVDDNANSKLDTGNLIEKQQPESVIYNVEPITIRPNWDLELDWKVVP
jgi:uncharacterized protein (DUF2141 family)